MRDSLKNEIINLLPSIELRKAIFERKTVFSDVEYLKMAFHYSPDFQTRIAVLDSLCKSFSGETKKYTDLLIKRQLFFLKDFSKSDSNIVFELRIKDNAKAPSTRYICRTFDAAKELIPLFFTEYNCKPSDEITIRMDKRKIISANDKSPFSDEYLGEAVFLPSRELFSVDIRNCEKCPCHGMAEQTACSIECVPDSDIAFPALLGKGDIVAFRIGLTQPEKIGVIPFSHDTDFLTDYFIIPLKSEDIRFHNYDTVFIGHQHIPVPLVRKIAVESLDEKTQKDYFAFMDYLEKSN